LQARKFLEAFAVPDRASSLQFPAPAADPSSAEMNMASHWIESAPLPRFPKLDRNLEVDVVVIGGGIMGITAAYLLKQAGRKVALLERDYLARVDTGHTTAHLTAVTDLSFQDAVKTFGKQATKAVWEAGAAAIDQIVSNIRSEGIACDFRWVPAYLHVPFENGTSKDREMLQREAAVARDLDIEAEFQAAIPFFDLPGVKFPHQALFHPRKYLSTLAQSIPGGGCHIFEKSEAEVQDKPLGVKADGCLIRCSYIVIATHNPLMGRASVMRATLFQSKLSLYSSYAVGAKIPSHKLPEASFWDTSKPYNYLRVDRHHGFDYAILGGEDHKTGQESDTLQRYRRLEQRLQRFIPEAEVDFQWSGQVIETTDGLPYIGEFVENQFTATGFAGNGMTFGTVGAMMARDAVLKRKNPWINLFDPGRKKLLGGAWTYLKENKDYPYYLLRDHLGGSAGKSLDDLKNGQGKILNLEGRKVAAYRNDDGEVSICSPVCTHLKCIVAWNEAERTWDCPCHGSRFKPGGEIISGPAEEPLERLTLSDKTE
jgi:glycine/D-amino acid oxidase-like deaminating enzyme/nitrite reductase/ring-hydroxylating ferredoxin subunit